MLAIDFIGLAVTVCLVGLRYPHYVVVAALIHDFGRVIMTLFFHGEIESLVAAGAFSTTTVSNLGSDLKLALVIFSGPLANYIVSATVGGVEFERTAALVSPFAVLTHPFAVINLRLAIISCLVNIWQFV